MDIPTEYCNFCQSEASIKIQHGCIMKVCHNCNICELSFDLFEFYLKDIMFNINPKYYSIILDLCKSLLNKQFGNILNYTECNKKCFLEKKEQEKQCLCWEYKFYTMKFLYCSYNNLIFFKEDELKQVINILNKKSKFIYIKKNIKQFIQHFVVKIKKLFIQEQF